MKARIIISALLGMACSAASAADLRIGTSADYPPWGAVDPKGEVVGFDREVGDAVCARLKTACIWQNQAFDGLLPGLIVGKYDLVMAAISITPERAKQVDFSAPYADAPNQFAVVASSPIAAARTVKDLEASIKGKTLGIQSGTTHEAVVSKHFPGVKLQIYSRTDQLANDLRSGRIDAGLMERSAWEAMFKDSKPALAYAGPLLSSADYPEFGNGQAITLAKNKPELKGAIDKAIADLLADGTMANLSKKWFGYDVSFKAK